MREQIIEILTEICPGVDFEQETALIDDGLIALDVKQIKGGTDIVCSVVNGGVLGGITSGMPLIVRACIKPTPSIGMMQETLNLRTGKVEPLSIHGRHDPCIVTRAAPVVEAACAVALADLLREAKGYHA